MNASDTFFDRERKPSRSETSRPRAVNPRTGVEQSWQQASNYASPLDNPHGLITWKLRELVKGLSLRPDLARMLLTGAVIEDNAKADELIADAHAAVAIAAKANEGTAVHAALSRSFLGHEVPAEYMPHVRAFASELQRNGLTPVATEVTTLCVALGVLGHTDWVVKTADGRNLILDVKTGKLGDAKRKFAVQCKAYAGAEYIDDGNGDWIPVPFALDQTEAILAHVDPETGATSLYRVDLVLGLYGATLAERVRDWSKIEVLAPYVPVHHAVPTGGVPHPELTPARVQNRGAVDAAALGSNQAPLQTPQYADHAIAALKVATQAQPPESMSPAGAPAGFLQTPTAWLESMGSGWSCQGDEAWATPMTRDDFLQRYQPRHDGSPVPATVVGTIEVTEPRPASAETALQATEQHATSPVAPSLDSASIEAERADLMQARNDKATLQKMAGNLGLKDLAHNRQWLADWIIATRRGADNVSAVAFAKSKGTTPLGGVPIGERPSTEEERQAGDLSFIFRSIEGAKSVGAIEALRSNIVERRGDRAWTDEMTEAARARVAELDAQNGVTVSPALQVLNQIAAATEQQHIAELWSTVTIGGSVEENWTPEMREAADKRMSEIWASQPPPPANPYGPPQ